MSRLKKGQVFKHREGCSCFRCSGIAWNKGSKGLMKPNSGSFDRSMFGDNARSWKGDKVKYSGLHMWVRQRKGTPQQCEICGDTSNRKYEWANISGEYKRDLRDWIRLCRPCHHRFDNISLKIWETRKGAFYFG